jgi:hypothetical protein
MENICHRVAENLFNQIDGPLHFRFIFQPTTAIIIGVLDGLRDVKAGKPPYFWAIIYNKDYRKELIKEGWKKIGRVFIISVIMDIIYQLKVYHWIYPGEMLIVSLILTIVPYILLRGPVNRIIQIFKKRIR